MNQKTRIKPSPNRLSNEKNIKSIEDFIKELERNPNIINKPELGNVKSLLIRNTIVQEQASYRGPLPPSAEFAKYEAACPGAAEKILDASRAALEANIAISKKKIENDYDEAKRGQLMAFGIALLSLIVGLVVTLCGYQWSGTLFGTGGLATVVYFFIQGKKR